MKPAIFVLSLLLLTAVGRAAAQSSAPDHKALAKRSLALRAAAQETLQWLSAQAHGSDPDHARLQHALAIELLANVEHHQNRKASGPKAKEWIINWRIQDFDRNASEVWERANEQSPLPINKEDMLNRATADWKQKRDDGARQFSDSAMKQLYPAARKIAIEQQRSSLKASLAFPSQDELDPLLFPLDQKRKQNIKPLEAREFRQLKNQLKPYAAHAGAVFEELKPDVARLADGMCDEIGHQYQQQTKFVQSQLQEGMLPTQVMTAPKLEPHLMDQLSASFKGNPSATPPQYAAFEIVKNWVPDLAADWERKQLKAYLASTKTWEPTATSIKTSISANLPSHQSPKKSADRLLRQTVDTQTAAVASGMAASAESKAHESLTSYFDHALRAPKNLGTVWEQAISHKISERLPEIRKALAQEQFTTYFPQLQETPVLAEPVILWFHDRKLNQADDIQHIITGLNVYGEHPIDAEVIPDLIDETRALAKESINLTLQPALQSLGAQLLIIRQLEEEQLEQLQKDVAAGVSLETLSAKWMEEWEIRWSSVSQEFPAPWTGIFDRSRKELDKAIRQLFESTEKSIPAATPVVSQTPSEQNAETEQPGSSEMTSVEVPSEESEKEKEEPKEEKPDPSDGDGEDEPKEEGMTEELATYSGRADGVLAFSDLSNGDCRLLFGSPDGTGALSVEFDPVQIERSALKIAAALRGPLREVLNGSDTGTSRGAFRLLNRSKTPELSMLFRVDSPAIRHQMSIRVRQHIKQEIQDWAAETGKTPPELLWQDESGSL